MTPTPGQQAHWAATAPKTIVRRLASARRSIRHRDATLARLRTDYQRTTARLDCAIALLRKAESTLRPGTTLTAITTFLRRQS